MVPLVHFQKCLNPNKTLLLLTDCKLGGSVAALAGLTVNCQDFIGQHNSPGTVLGNVLGKTDDIVTILEKQTAQLKETEAVQKAPWRHSGGSLAACWSLGAEF